MMKPEINGNALWFAVARLQCIFTHLVSEVRYIDSLFHRSMRDTEFQDWIEKLIKSHTDAIHDLRKDATIEYSEQDIYYYYFTKIKSAVNNEYVNRINSNPANQGKLEWVKDILFKSVDLAYMPFDEHYQ